MPTTFTDSGLCGQASLHGPSLRTVLSSIGRDATVARPHCQRQFAFGAIVQSLARCRVDCKANQTLSSELQLDKPLSKLLDIMIENAGAQIAALVLNQHESTTLIAKTSILPGETAEDIAREPPCAISGFNTVAAGHGALRHAYQRTTEQQHTVCLRCPAE